MGDEDVGVVEEGPPLGMSGQRPDDTGVPKHMGRDLSGESTLLLGVDVLGGNGDLGGGLGRFRLDVLGRGDQVQRRSGDDDLCRKKGRG